MKIRREPPLLFIETLKSVKIRREPPPPLPRVGVIRGPKNKILPPRQQAVL
jgi:hypothetical protein